MKHEKYCNYTHFKPIHPTFRTIYKKTMQVLLQFFSDNFQSVNRSTDNSWNSILIRCLTSQINISLNYLGKLHNDQVFS